MLAIWLSSISKLCGGNHRLLLTTELNENDRRGQCFLEQAFLSPNHFHSRGTRAGSQQRPPTTRLLSQRRAKYKNGGRGGRDWLRRGGGGWIQRSRCRPREEKEALLQRAPVYDVRIWRRPEPLHGVCGYSGGPGDRVYHGNDPQSYVYRTPGPRPGGGHRLPHSQGPQEVRQGQRPTDHERRAEESPESFRRSQLWLLT